MFTYAKKSLTTAEFILNKKTTKIKQNMSGIMSTKLNLRWLADQQTK